MPQDTNVNNLIINTLTKKQYESIENPSSTELYFITDENYADGSLGDLDQDGENRLHALKGYEDAGEILRDEEGFGDVCAYAHSTFDRSKFNVVGSPIVTTEGIASGFSNGNYLTATVSFPSSYNTLEFCLGEFIVPNFSNPQWFYWNKPTSSPSDRRGILIEFNESGKTRWLAGSGASDWDITAGKIGDITYTANTKIKFKLTFSGSRYTLYSSVNGGEWQVDSYVDSSLKLLLSNTSILGSDGSADSGNYLRGSIDLKYVSFKVDNVPVFSGNKTGIDTIKPDNYIVVGSPTISEDGLASGFVAQTSYLKAPLPSGWGSDYRIECSGIYGDVGNIWGAQDEVVSLDVRGNSVNFYVNTSTFMSCTLGGTLSTGDRYKVIASNKNGNQTVTCISKYGTFTNTAANTAAAGTSPYLNIGAAINGLYGITEGSIDLNEFKIYVKDNLVYQACLKIPYTESKTGSKIVNSIYKSRVEDMYDQFGTASYYVLQESDSRNFIIIGTPSIDGNNVVSGFSNSNYVITPSIAISGAYKIQFKINTTSLSAWQTILQYNDNNRIVLNTSGTIDIAMGGATIFNFLTQHPLVTNTNYLISVSSDGNSTITVKAENLSTGAEYSDTQTMTTSLISTPVTWLIGSRAGTNPFVGSIDLNEFKIYANGVLAFEAITKPYFSLPQGEVYGMIENKLDKKSEVIHALKSYKDEGEMLSDEEGYEDVFKYNHSTFDSSKFTLQNTPTVTADGIASNFSGGTYVKTVPVSTISTSNFIIREKFKLSNATVQNTLISSRIANINSECGLSLIVGSDGKLLTWLSSDGSTWDIAGAVSGATILSVGVDYLVQISFNGSQYKYELTNLETGITTTQIVINSTSQIYSGTNTLALGSSGGSWVAMSGEIDLKGFSIFIDGKPVFSGAKTAIDIVKPNLFEVVGSPTVDTYGIASNFSTSNYIKAPLSLIAGSSYTIKGRITISTVNSLTVPMDITDASSNLILSLRVNDSGSRMVLVYKTSDSTSTIFTSSNSIVAGGTYDYEINIVGSNLTFTFDNVPYTTVTNFSNVATSLITIGVNKDFSYAFAGSIDLNALKVISNGSVIYQSCLKVPYTLSSTGSKIVDICYKDRVDDVFEQYGSASYYVIDEQNEKFALPQGEVYGLIKNNSTDIETLNNKTRALKGYEDRGGWLYDKEGYEDVAEYAHSTFDASKFTIVGSPVSNDGLVTDVDSSNYITTPSIDPSETDFCIELDYICGNTSPSTDAGSSEMLLWIRGGSSNYCNIEYYFDNSLVFRYGFSTIAIAQPRVIGKYHIKCQKKSTSMSISLSINGKFIATDSKTIDSSNTCTAGVIYIGSNNAYSRSVREGNYIDLKSLVIRNDGVPVFSGNSTGLDTIKPDKYKKVGSPTVTEDGIASGFSSSNAIQTDTTTSPFYFYPTGPWTIEGAFTCPSSVTDTRGTLVYNLIGISLQIALLQDLKIGVFLSSNGSSFNIANNVKSSTTLIPNTKYFFKMEFTGTSYDLYISTLYDITWNLQASVASTSTLYLEANRGLKIGAAGGGNVFPGTIDLNAFKVYYGKDLVYQACLNIPYTWSKTGSKVADAYYWKRVKDMYSQFGYAPYYTIYENNKAFALPQGEVYGMMRAQASSYYCPDYSTGVSITVSPTSPYTAEYDGWIYLQCSNFPADASLLWYINNMSVGVYATQVTGQSVAGYSPFWIPIQKGQVLSCTYNEGSTSATFVFRFFKSKGV